MSSAKLSLAASNHAFLMVLLGGICTGKLIVPEPKVAFPPFPVTPP